MTNEKIAELSGIPLDCVRQTIKRVPISGNLSESGCECTKEIRRIYESLKRYEITYL